VHCGINYFRLSVLGSAEEKEKNISAAELIN
jgi:hypothetical protein